MKTQILQNNNGLGKKEEKILLDSLSIEVDNIFIGLRKADQIIRRELNWLNKRKLYELKIYAIDSIDDGNFKRIIEQMPAQHFLLDEYVAYMLESENNSLFNLIKEYNLHLELRNQVLAEKKCLELIKIDDKLVYYIRNLGAMMYHLNIHLNLLHVFYRNTSPATES